MGRTYLSVTDGTFTMSETDVKNQFYFYRNDGGTLDVDGLSREPIELFQSFIIHRMMTGNMKLDFVCKDIEMDLSGDKKVILVTAWNGMTMLPRFAEHMRRSVMKTFYNLIR